MVTRSTRIAALPALVLLFGAVVACTGQDSTPSATPSATASSPAPEPSDADTLPGATVREQGYAFSCSGARGDGNTVIVELYTNSAVEVPASVVVVRAGEEGEPMLLTSDAAEPPTIADGEVSADVPLVDAVTKDDAGTAEVRGTYEPTGDVREVDQEIEDAGQGIRSVGTNEDLTADLGVRIGAEQVDLECSEAFAFDLQVTRTPIS